jgi:para-nitrobenzyl esterase
MHYLKKFSLVLIFCFTLHQISAAQERYHEHLYDSIDVQTFTYIVKNGENLDIDVYTPFCKCLRLSAI